MSGITSGNGLRKVKSKNMTKRSWQGGSIRTTITLDRKLVRDCKKLMIIHGYGKNFSAFLADAARAQRRRLQRQQAA